MQPSPETFLTPPYSTTPPNFDRLARLYRWLEYLALGRALERTRTQFLPVLPRCRHALILGDGDGRFTAALLQQQPELQAEAVDASRAMLQALRRRVCGRVAGARLSTTAADLRVYSPRVNPDLIVTHFVLDCLHQHEAERLIEQLCPRLTPGGFWLVSEFGVPTGLLHWPARLYIRSLYFAFRLLTGLRVTRVPDYETPMRRAGLKRLQEDRSLFGLLRAQLWQKPWTQSCLPPTVEANRTADSLRE